MSKLLKLLGITFALILPMSMTGCNQGSSYKDGTYIAYGDSYNFYNYKPFVVVEVKNGLMVQSSFDCISSSGELLTESREMKAQMLKDLNVSPVGFTKELALDLLIKQGTSNSMSASLASDANKIFKEMVDSLISERIEKGDDSVLTTKTLSVEK